MLDDLGCDRREVILHAGLEGAHLGGHVGLDFGHLDVDEGSDLCWDDLIVDLVVVDEFRRQIGRCGDVEVFD